MGREKSLIIELLLTLSLAIAAVAATHTAIPTSDVIAQTDMNGSDGFFLVKVPLPEGGNFRNHVLKPVVEEGDAYLVHAFSFSLTPHQEPQSSKEDGNSVTIAGRYQKSGYVRILLQTRDGEGKTRNLLKVGFRLTDAPSSAPAVRKTWARMQQQAMSAADLYAHDHFTHYWQLAIASQYGLSPLHGYDMGRDRREPPDMYSIFTGAAAIQESLQLEALRTPTRRGTANTGSSEQVKLAALIGPKVKSHPFKEMLKGKTPQLPVLASLIPQDQYAVFFSDINKQIELEELMEEWGGNLLNQAAASAQDYKVRSKISRQLCLTSSLLTKWLGDRVIAGMAFTGNDPFLKEGTAFTVLMTLKNEKRFRKHLDGKHDEAVAKSGAKRFETVIDGRTVKGVRTDDRSISSYVAYLDGTAVVSNSLNGIRNILNARNGKAVSLAQADDFRYMRTIFPQGANEEDIFIYLSDAHIRQLVSPRSKIGEARRMQCAANLGLIANARLWFVTEKRREPTMQELEKGGYLGAAKPTCPDHGHYSIDKDGRPTCSIHNRTGQLTPLTEIPLEKVTKDEAGQYNEFVRDYNRYWTQFFDPIGIRIKMGRDIRIQTVILPLIENSWYDGLTAFAGRKPGTLTEHMLLPRTIVSLRGSLPDNWLKDKRLKDEYEEYLHTRGMNLDWVGKEVSLNLCDGHALFSASNQAVGELMGRGMGRNATKTMVVSYLMSALNLPTYMAVKVNDPLQAEKSIPALFGSMMGRKSRSDEFYVETYAVEDHRGKPVYVANYNLWIIKLRLYSAVIDDRLVTASRRDIITDLMDRYAQKGDARPAGQEGSLEMSVYRSAFKDFAEHVNIGWQEEMRRACHSNIPLASIMMEGLGTPEEKLAGSIQQLRGYEPYCPSGGKYAVLPGSKTVGCSIHGTPHNPRQPAESPADSRTMQLLNSIEKINARLAFTPEGLMTTVVIRRKK
ncbi:MAG TPA: hypothetical protein PL053_09690 [Deltaproteobacteria bacterium]|nr:hypothetical protein [Deltaproteobacteria bacterium]